MTSSGERERGLGAAVLSRICDQVLSLSDAHHKLAHTKPAKLARTPQSRKNAYVKHTARTMDIVDPPCRVAAPKKQQKMSLNEFLGDSSQSHTLISLKHPALIHVWCAALGSWADEMDALPTARTSYVAFRASVTPTVRSSLPSRRQGR